MSISHAKAEAELSWNIFNEFACRWRGKGKLGKAWAADDLVHETTFVWQLFTFPHRSSEVTVKLWHPNNIAKY